MSTRIDLFRTVPLLKKFVKMRSFQFLVVFPNLLFFYLFLIAGLFGSPVGNRNVIIIFVWIFWWFLLIVGMTPFGSRIWCTICPLPFFGDLLQRRTLISVRPGKTGPIKNKLFGLNKRWPKKLSNIWLQNFGFLSMATFSAMLLTRPIVSVGVFAGMILIATVLALVYRLRTFCSYLCPISGFLSLYSMASTVELRSADKDVCTKCRTKSCVTGNEKGWGCPWFVYMGKLDRNNYCGLCMECVKTCPNDNIGLFVRPFAADTDMKGYDESWKAFIMLTLAMVYSVTLLGPWGVVKDWANVSEVGNWTGFAIYAAIIWFAALILLPAVYLAAVWLGRRFAGEGGPDLKKVFLKFSYVFVPFGLLAWIAFTVPLVMVNGSYVISVMSDPLGRGWDLFGTADFPWTPFYPETVGYVQIPLLLLGLYFSLKRGLKVGIDLYGTGRRAVRGLAPVAALLLLLTLGFLKVYLA